LLRRSGFRAKDPWCEEGALKDSSEIKIFDDFEGGVFLEIPSFKSEMKSKDENYEQENKFFI
jgi:hypothetical protein